MDYDTTLNLTERLKTALQDFELKYKLNYDSIAFKNQYPNFAKYWVENHGDLKEIMNFTGGYIWDDG